MMEHLLIQSDNGMHNKLGLHKGFNGTRSSLFNLTLMCMGIKSPGTLNEVLRGYIGDRRSDQIYSENQTSRYSYIPIANPLLFDRALNIFSSEEFPEK